MKVGSLFSGIDGFGLGFERAGMEVRWQVEVDAACTRVLTRHWPEVTRHGDIKELDPDDLEPVDLICGGFPCQDLSVAGKRGGLGASRSGLFWELARIVAARRPRWVVVENVPGLLSAVCPDRRGRPVPGGACTGGCMARHGGAMGIVLGTLAELGYVGAWRVLDARYFDLAQRRERVFLVCCLGDRERAQAVLLESQGLRRNPAKGAQAGEDLAGTLGSSPAGGGWRSDTDRMTFIPEVSVALTSRASMDRPESGAVTLVPVATRGGERQDPTAETFIPVGFAWQAGGHADATSSMHQEMSPTLSASQEMAVAYQCHGSNVGPMGVLRRGNGNGSHDAGQNVGELSPTLRGGPDNGGVPPAVAFSENQQAQTRLSGYAPALGRGGGKPGQGYPADPVGMKVRRLMPIECERLQGFPDGHTAQESDSARYRMLGNAVPVPVVEWIGRRILAAESAA